MKFSEWKASSTIMNSEKVFLSFSKIAGKTVTAFNEIFQVDQFTKHPHHML